LIRLASIAKAPPDQSLGDAAPQDCLEDAPPPQAEVSF
jgi:hypothetical protein